MATENMTATVMAQFAEKIDINTEYTVSELKRILGDVYKGIQLSIAENKKAEKMKNGEKQRKVRTKRERDENGDIIKKRAPSAYNIFIKEQSAIIKQSNPGMDPKAIFKEAIALWKKNKGTDAANDEPVPEPEPVPDDDTANPKDPNEASPEPSVLKPKKAAKAVRKPKKAADAPPATTADNSD